MERRAFFWPRARYHFDELKEVLQITKTTQKPEDQKNSSGWKYKCKYYSPGLLIISAETAKKETDKEADQKETDKEADQKETDKEADQKETDKEQEYHEIEISKKRKRLVDKLKTHGLELNFGTGTLEDSGEVALFYVNGTPAIATATQGGSNSQKPERKNTESKSRAEELSAELRNDCKTIFQAIRSLWPYVDKAFDVLKLDRFARESQREGRVIRDEETPGEAMLQCCDDFVKTVIDPFRIDDLRVKYRLDNPKNPEGYLWNIEKEETEYKSEVDKSEVDKQIFYAFDAYQYLNQTVIALEYFKDFTDKSLGQKEQYFKDVTDRSLTEGRQKEVEANREKLDRVESNIKLMMKWVAMRRARARSINNLERQGRQVKLEKLVAILTSEIVILTGVQVYRTIVGTFAKPLEPYLFGCIVFWIALFPLWFLALYEHRGELLEHGKDSARNRHISCVISWIVISYYVVLLILQMFLYGIVFGYWNIHVPQPLYLFIVSVCLTGVGALAGALVTRSRANAYQKTLDRDVKKNSEEHAPETDAKVKSSGKI